MDNWGASGGMVAQPIIINNINTHMFANAFLKVIPFFSFLISARSVSMFEPRKTEGDVFSSVTLQAGNRTGLYNIQDSIFRLSFF